MKFRRIRAGDYISHCRMFKIYNPSLIAGTKNVWILYDVEQDADVFAAGTMKECKEQAAA